MKFLRNRLPKADINLLKVTVGVAFSLVWGKVMYIIWPKPPYLTFLWFYLGIGSVVLKWVLFEIVDRISLRMRIKNMEKEIDEAQQRKRMVEPREED